MTDHTPLLVVCFMRCWDLQDDTRVCVCVRVSGSDGSCVWELIHCRSEVEGRPETVFQLCSR